MKRHCVVLFDGDTYEFKGVYILKTFNYQFELIEKTDKIAFKAHHYVTVRNKQTGVIYRACLDLIQ